MPDISRYFKYANLQMAAESLFGVVPTTPVATVTGPESLSLGTLLHGNGRGSLFTDVLAENLISEKWEVVSHQSNTRSGFSGTLFMNRDTGELVLSFRSTEFVDDAVRDNQATNAMEIQPFGWAFGQIADMENWVRALGLGDASPLTVTGYSLGGHLATAFNLLHPGWAKETYTFNGAGVGTWKSGDSLAGIIARFDQMRSPTADLSDQFTDPDARSLYQSIRSTQLSGQGITSGQRLLAYGLWISRVPGLPTDAGLLWDAITRIDKVEAESARIANYQSGTAQDSLHTVPLGDVAATKLNYQLAVLIAARRTQNNGILADTFQTVLGRRQGPILPNVYDVFGSAPPSAVSNSQLHQGVPVPIFIEDQPLWRGDIVPSSALQSLLYLDVKLLSDRFAINDFGDTHSLVLLIDSLAIQNALAKLDPSASPNLAAILQAASNARKESGGGENNQGKAEGDVLENTLNVLSRIFLGPNALALKGKLVGGTWALIADRNALFDQLKALQIDPTFLNVAGRVQLVKFSGPSGLAADAATDFASFLSLLNLSPFTLKARAPYAIYVEAALAKPWELMHTNWLADKNMSAPDRLQGAETFTQQWRTDRAVLLDWMVLRNDKNLQGVIAGGDAGRTVVEGVAFEDRSTLLKILVGATDDPEQRRQVIFGGTGSDSLGGYGKEDHLYGSNGADVMQGQGGNDYLEGNADSDKLYGGDGNDKLLGGDGDDSLIDGGADSDVLLGGNGADKLYGGADADDLSGGSGVDELDGGTGNDFLDGGDGVDKYVFSTGWGADVIRDRDGTGQIAVTGLGPIDGSGATQLTPTPNVWQTASKAITYTLLATGSGRNDLLIRFSSRSDTILIRDWSPTRNVGITLAAATAPPAPTGLVFLGDFQKLHDSTSYAVKGFGGNGYEFQNYSWDGPASMGAPDMIAGTLQGDQLYGLLGDDALSGWEGDDWIDGGKGDDFLSGNTGADTILGGDGVDVAFGSGWGGFIHGPYHIIGLPSDFPGGGPPSYGPEINRGFGWVTYHTDVVDANGFKGIVTDGVLSQNIYFDIQNRPELGNLIDGGKGDDWLYGGVSDDTVYGGEDHDHLIGQDGRDLLFGDSGNDEIVGDGPVTWGYVDSVPEASQLNDTLVGGSGDDSLLGDGGNDELYGGADNDKLWGDETNPKVTPWTAHGSDYLDGGDGTDYLYGGGVDDTLVGGAGTDTLFGDASLSSLEEQYHGEDSLDGGDGNDYLEGGGRDDTLVGGADDDVLWGDATSSGLSVAQSGADELDGGSGNDSLVGGGNADTLVGGTGNDVLIGDGDYVELAAEAADEIDGGEGDDTIYGDGGDDTLEGGEGADSIVGGLGIDILDGAGGNDALQGEEGTDYLDGGSGDDSLTAGADDDYAYGGDGNDILVGNDGNDYLDGASGDDTLVGGAGIDTLVGGAGRDVLQGGAGNDIYVFSSGDSYRDPNGDLEDVIVDEEGENIVQIEGSTPSTVFVTASGDLELAFSEDDRIAIYAGASGSFTYQFGGGSIYTTRELIGAFSDDIVTQPGSGASVAIWGGRQGDAIGSSQGHSTISGGQGNDTLTGSGGNNTYLYSLGDGADVLLDTSAKVDAQGVAAPNRVKFGAGITATDLHLTGAVGALTIHVGANPDDSITIASYDQGNAAAVIPIDLFEFPDGSLLTFAQLIAQGFDGADGDDTISATAGNDRASGGAGNDILLGQAGNDTLDGGAGNDSLVGGTGNDAYVFGIGSGSDVIDSTDAGSGKVDTLRLDGLAPADISLRGSGNDLIVVLRASGEQITITGYFSGTPIERIEFADGSFWNAAQMLANISSPLTEGSDAYFGAAGGDVVSALGGNDTLRGLDGSDVLDGAGGNDSVYGGNGNDSLFGGDGTDVLYGEAGDNLLDGGAGNDLLLADAGNDILRGGDGNDQLYGYAGQDALDGGAGDDSLFGGAAADLLSGGEGQDYLSDAEGNNSFYGGAGNDYLYGGAGDEWLDGGAGQDTIYAGNGQNTLVDGEYMAGGTGNDTFVLTALSGVVQIQDAGGAGDALVLPGDVAPAAVHVRSFYDIATGGIDDVVLSIDGHGDIQIAKYLLSPGASDKIEEIRFADGTIWRPSDVFARLPINNLSGGDDRSVDGFSWGDTIDALDGDDVVSGNGGDDSIDGNTGADYLYGGLGNDTLLGSAGNDYLSGDEGNDSLSGGADDDVLTAGRNGDASDGANVLDGGSGNDSLYGGAGSDTLIGGSGNDQLNGGGGGDTYRLGRSSGRDAMNVGAGFDRIVFDADVLPADITLFRDNVDLIVAIGQTLAQTRIVNYFANAAYQVESLEFANGVIWNAAAIVSHTVAGTANAMTGTAANNTYLVDDAGDTVSEGANQGTDIINSSVSFTLPANVENITLTGYADVNATGNTLNNVITGNTGNNVLRGAVGDTLTGGAGDDTYYGGGVIVELAGGGIDTVFVSDDYTLPSNVENLAADTQLANRAIHFVGNGLDNVITGRSSVFHPYRDIYDGGAGADLMIDLGDDGIFYVDNPGDRIVSASAIVFSSVDWTLASGHSTLNLIGSGGISGNGNALANTLDGSSNSAANILRGGSGDDTYRVGAGDTVVELAGEGTDTVEFNYRPADSQLGVGAFGAAEIERFGVGANAGGSLTLSGSSGADNLFYDGVDYQAFGLAIGGTLRGLEGDDTLVGSIGRDRLDGGSGSDFMRGGDGDDVYVVNSVGDVIVDSSGVDSVEATVSWALTAGLENLTLLGSDAIAAFGNAQANTLDGSLNGAANLLIGGAGDDTYVLGAGDGVVENAGEGRDRVMVDGTFVATANVEDVSLLGTAGYQLNGNALANYLTGNAGNNLIDGGAGADTMVGGGGSDAFVVDDIGDVVIGNFGLSDLVQSAVSFALGNEVDNLTLTGAAALNGTGNSLANVLTGNGAANMLDGAAGNDTLDGGLGNDTYLFGRGDGLDVIAEATADSAVGKLNTLQFKSGVLVSDIALTRVGNDLELEIAGTADKITIRSFYLGNDPANPFNPIQQIRFADTTTWNTAAILAQVAIAISHPLHGTAGNDTLNGAGVNWMMDGGLGNDVYLVDGAGDVVIELVGQGTDRVDSSVSYSLDANIENLTLTGAAAIDGTGNTLANALVGNGAANRLDGGGGIDTMSGGQGNDTYVVDNAADVVTETANAGTDTVESSLNWTLGANLENLRFTGAANLTGTGNTLPNTIYGNDGNNTLDGGVGNDTLVGGKGDDLYLVEAPNFGDVIVEAAGEGTDSVVSSVNYMLSANVENLTLTGSALSGWGNADANLLVGTSGNNTLAGGLGADTLRGGLGNDTYVIDDSNTVIVENAGEGTDIAQTNVSYALGANVENLMMFGAADLAATGNASNNTLTGNAGNNRLDGGAGADTLVGGQGADVYVVDDAGDVITESYSDIDTVEASITYTLGAGVENLVLTGAQAIDAYGNLLANVLRGNAAANRLDGGTGADTLQGGGGDDIYVVSDVGDVVVEAMGEGVDTVESSLSSYTLDANVENLTLVGVGATGIGNAGANLIVGSGANNVLDGGAGADTMIGHGGNDTYVVDEGGDSIVEALNEGIDTVTSSIAFALGVNLENLTLTGSASVAAVGNELANSISGNAGSNVIDGGAGADWMYGGAGNDTYVIDNVADMASENDGEGFDVVLSTVSVSAIGSIENITLTGGAAIDATGNQFDNLITGNSAANVLDGGTGVDTLSGGTGDDTYRVDNAADVIVENAGEGTDAVQSKVSYVLGANVENLTLTGQAEMDGTGNAGANILVGNDYRNVLDGGAGADTLVGGRGDDVYMVDSAGDVIVEAMWEGTDLVLSTATYVLGAEVENLTLVGATSINGTGNALANLLTGNGAGNALDGGLGNDTLQGGLGDDTYVVDAGDVVVELVGGGNDTVLSDVDILLAANLENATLTGSNGVGAWGNDLANVLVGNAADNRLDGQMSADTMRGGAGNDYYLADNVGDVAVENLGEGVDTVQSAVSFVLGSNVENLILTGSAALSGTGNALANTIAGNVGDNVLDGGAGADTMSGDSGADTYLVDNAGDVVVETGFGSDLVISSVSYVLAANVDNLTLTGTALSGTGNADANVLTGNGADNVLDGGAGADTLVGGLGNDTYLVDSTGDVITEAVGAGVDIAQSTTSYALGANVENLTLVGGGAINGSGNSLANVLAGNAGANRLDGGAGADTMIGGAGDDTYVVDVLGDVVTELSGGGFDTVESASSYTLGAEVENLLLTGSSAINGIGNSLSNTLTGNGAANVLDGGAGNDLFYGGLGDDTYIADSSSDFAVESAGAGIDLVQSSASYTLGANVENLTLTGSGVINGTGNTLANVLSGNGANNRLDGGAGIDTMIGGLGNDTYVVDVLGDVVTELAAGGTDTVETVLTYTLGAEIENLTLTGSGAVNGTGNALANVLAGNTGNNVLDAGAGIDTMVGGAGNDTYVVDSSLDVVTEAASAGTDLAQASVNYILAANLENLTLTGTSAINGTGNIGANLLTGNNADNILDGGTGIDTMVGGLGNDIYIVDVATDVTTEAASAGTDTVQSNITWSLAANLENLTLGGSAAINGTGNTGANVLVGNSGNNVLDGGSGADTMTGGLGNDTYVVDNALDVTGEAAAGGSDLVQASVNWTLAAEIENLTLTGTALNGTGNAVANGILGNASNNRLDGGAGVDAMTGGAGNDTYVVDVATDTTIEVAGGGTDTVEASLSWTLGTEVENLLLTGTAAINGTGNSLANVLTGNVGDNVLNGGAGSDTMVGGLGNDTYVVDVATDVTTEAAGAGTDTVQSNITWTLAANIENLTLGGGSAINGIGNTLANVLNGNASVNRLDGGTGADTMIGGAGNDTYVVENAADTITELASGGSDTVESSLNWTLAAEVENLTLTGTALNGTGNTVANVLLGNASSNRLDGGGGADTMTGGAGNDTYVVDVATDTTIEIAAGGTDTVESGISWTLGAEIENLLLTGTSAVNGTGNVLANLLTGNGADNVLNGGPGSDTMIGGLGNDTYVVDVSTDVTTEAVGAGTDTVQSLISWTLGANLENLTLTGTGTIDATGNTAANVITGNASDNVLSGGAGADTMIGAAGNDTYAVDDALDVITEAAGAGTDTVRSVLGWTLGANLENLVLLGAGAINGTGNTLANQLTGNSGNNVLDGGSGADTMTGGLGNDTYLVDNLLDATVEAAAGGTDLVQANLSWALAAEVENLTLTGTALNGTGNALANAILGNASNNRLDGGAGADAMTGGGGNDTYVVDVATDTTIEVASGGTDTVESSINWTLAAEVENLLLTGSGALNGTGNAANNVLTGNAGDNLLNGLAGADTMIGGLGNDTYIVDATTDVVTEVAAGGTDVVQSSATFTLGTEVERLTLTGSTAINGIGNGLDNQLTGNTGANVLTGGAGNDTLDGAAGPDTLVGATGNDTFVLGRGYGGELIQENDATVGNTDVLSFLAGVTSEQIWFRHVGNDLEVSIIGTADTALIQNWYLGNQYHVEQFKTSDGKTLLDSKVQDLVNAMAGFTPPAIGQTTLPPTYQTSLLPVIGADWGP